MRIRHRPGYDRNHASMIDQSPPLSSEKTIGMRQHDSLFIGEERN
jgi:hypothetical protein